MLQTIYVVMKSQQAPKFDRNSCTQLFIKGKILELFLKGHF